MTCPSHASRRLRWHVLMVALLSLAPASWMPAQGQSCPVGPTVTITRPTQNAQNLSGIVYIGLSLENAPPGWTWTGVRLRLLRQFGGGIDPVYATFTDPTHAYFAWDTTAGLNGFWTIEAFATLLEGLGQAQCDYYTIRGVTVSNPASSRHMSQAKLRCACRRDCVPTGSHTSPLSGNQSFSVPITSWEYRGATFGVALTYKSGSLHDPYASDPPNFAGLSQKNSKWSHTYAQWVDFYQDEAGTRYAVWHRNGGAVAFQEDAANPGQFLSPESNLNLYASGNPITSPSFPCGTGSQTLQVDYSTFEIVDADGISYRFNYLPPVGQTHVVWSTAPCTAIPHYLLSGITDRWGRYLTVNWSNDPAEPRVTSVRTGAGPTVTFNYDGAGLLTNIVDAQARTHTMGYTSVLDENDVPRQKLTQVTVYGPGSPNRVVHVWSFAYRDDADPKLAYGGSTDGTYTGDLVIRKTSPDGMVTHYRYEKVTLVGTPKVRPSEEDWDGRVTRIAWSDPEGTGGERVITRSKPSATEAILTYPGGVATRYGYSGEDLTLIKDEGTGRT